MTPRILPCKKCGSTNIVLSDCGYSAFNPGGGKCRACGYEVTSEAGCIPSRETLTAIWNAGQTFTAEEKLAEVDRALYGDKKFNYEPNRAVTIRALRALSFKPALQRLQHEISQWAAETFPGQTPKSKAEHLRDEASELVEYPADGEEMADILILLLNIAELAEVDILAAVYAKMAKNRARTWGPPDERGVCHHIEG